MVGSSIPRVCPNCGSTDFLGEPALDEDGMPTGFVLVTCASCGREIGELPPLEPGTEVEPPERFPPVAPDNEDR